MVIRNGSTAVLTNLELEILADTKIVFGGSSSPSFLENDPVEIDYTGSSADSCIDFKDEVTGAFVFTGSDSEETILFDISGTFNNGFSVTDIDIMDLNVKGTGDDGIDLGTSSGLAQLILQGGAQGTVSGDLFTITDAESGINLVLSGDGAEYYDQNQDLLFDVDLSFKGAGQTAKAERLTISVNNDGQDMADQVGTPSDQTEYALETGIITTQWVEDIFIDAKDTDVIMEGLNAEGMETLTIAAEEDFFFGSALEAGTIANSQETRQHLSEVDVSQVAGGFTAVLASGLQAGWDLSNDTDVEFTYSGAAGADTLTLGDQDTDTSANGSGHDIRFSIDTDTGDDTLILNDIGAVYNDAVLELSFGSGDDTLDLANGNDDVLLGNDAHVIAFGGGSDTLLAGEQGGDLAAADLSGLENISITGAGHVIVAAENFMDGGSNDIDVTVSTMGSGRLIFKGTDVNDTLDLAQVLINGNGEVTLSDLNGSAGLSGGSGNDALTGGQGDDVIIGGDGADTMTGGDGSDQFILGSIQTLDTVTDFNAGAGSDDILSFDVDGSAETGAFTLTEDQASTLLRFGDASNAAEDISAGSVVQLMVVDSQGAFTTTDNNNMVCFEDVAQWNSAAGIQAALNDGGDTIMTFSNTADTGTLLCAYNTNPLDDQSGDTVIAAIQVNNASDTSQAQVVDLVTLSGVSDSTLLSSADFTFI